MSEQIEASAVLASSSKPSVPAGVASRSIAPRSVVNVKESPSRASGIEAERQARVGTAQLRVDLAQRVGEAGEVVGVSRMANIDVLSHQRAPCVTAARPPIRT